MLSTHKRQLASAFLMTPVLSPRIRSALARLALGAAALLVGGVAVAGAAPLATVTEYAVGLNTGTSPAAITSGPDGNLWFTDAGTTKAVGRITPSGTITEFSAGLSPGSALRVIATGPDGNLWFADAGATPAIGRITTSGVITEFSAGLNQGSSPDGVVAGPDGNIWFTDRGTTPAVGRITMSGVITEFAAGLNPGSSAHGITVGQDGNLWFVDPGATPAIGRATTSGVITEFSAGLNPGSLPDVIARGPDGNLWFSDQNRSRGAVGRITTSGVITEFSTGFAAGGFSRGIAAGADGNLWFTDQGTTKAIGRITTAGTITEFTSGLNAGSTPFRIAAGPDGNVWFSDTGPTKAIAQFGLGAPTASIAIDVRGGGNLGATQTCDDSWSSWAGEQPSHGAFGFDGYTWLLDGAPITRQTSQSYAPRAADVGHALSCRATVTYTLFPTTVLATSPGVEVKGAAEQLAAVGDAVAGVGPGKSLAKKLDAAQAALAAGDDGSACSILAALMHEVEAQTGDSRQERCSTTSGGSGRCSAASARAMSRGQSPGHGLYGSGSQPGRYGAKRDRGSSA
jgi:streptogramin lyase